MNDSNINDMLIKIQTIVIQMVYRSSDTLYMTKILQKEGKLAFSQAFHTSGISIFRRDSTERYVFRLSNWLTTPLNLSYSPVINICRY